MNKLLKSLLTLLVILPPQHAMANPAWIEQASRPGPDTAPIGQSRFDQLFRQASGGYKIPYPFERLIETLENQLDNGDQRAVRQALIPIGRSLQRDTPAPDYFQLPRKVITLEGEPITVGMQPGRVMEYRLFIAHQPSTEVLEIISYNDAAGRFEFQLVEDYAADKSPRVRSAKRVMCMSCHHNAAPIFSRNPWSETNANVEVATSLASALPQKFSSLVDVISLDAGIIDMLAERANYLSAAQAIWQQGCDSLACRAAMLRAVLQYRLSGNSTFDSGSVGYRRDYFDNLSRNWRRQWPQGLVLAGSRLSDRNPFAAEEIKISQDPLMPRPAQATWYDVDSILASGIIYRLAGFFSANDIRRLDRHMIETGSSTSMSYRYRANCSAQAGDIDSYILHCGDRSSREGLQAQFEVDVLRDDIQSLRIASLKVPLDSSLLQPDIVELTRLPGRLEAWLGNGHNQLSMRLANGNRIESMTLVWDESLFAGQSKLELNLRSDFDVVEQALSRLLDRHLRGQASSLGQGAFRRKPILRELMQELGMDSLDWGKTVQLDAPRQQHSLSASLSGDLALLAPYCEHCHGDDSRQPPGFLFGNRSLQQIIECAPRMLRRLQAWQDGNDSATAPMPPPASIEFSGISAGDWPLSDHYHKLVASLENLVIQRQGEQRLADWQQTDYQRLPPCPGAASER